MKKLLLSLPAILFISIVQAQNIPRLDPNGVTQSATTPAVTTQFSTVHYIGETYGGGIVFYISDSGRHGLIAAPADQQAKLKWNNGTNVLATPVRNDGIGIGRNNTDAITAKQGHGNYAAFSCARYAGSGFADWYLPSKYELNLLYLKKAVVGGFANDFYWSSSEFDISMAYMQDFTSGAPFQSANDKNDALHIRAVRAF